MIETPKTDRAALLACDVDADTYVVPADFARQLERELAEAMAYLPGPHAAQEASSSSIRGAMASGALGKQD